MSDQANDRKLALVYDRQCPVCRSYSTMTKIRESLGELQLVDARAGGRLVDEITARGWDLDQGMVLVLEQEMYYGANAIHALSLISSRHNFFNRINYWVFKHKNLAKFLYPIMRSGRNLMLKILGRSKINNLNQPGNDRF